MNSHVDILTDIKDCEFIKYRKVIGGKLLIHIIHELAAVDCTKCEVDLAYYRLSLITTEEENDLTAYLCIDCYAETAEHISNLPRFRTH